MAPKPLLLASLALAAGLAWASASSLGDLLGAWFPAPLPGAVRLWVCDRDAGAVVGLDDSHLVAARFAVPWPTMVVVRGDGRLWVACAVGGQPEGEHELWLLTPGGRTLARHGLGVLLDLGLCGGDAAVVLERSGPEASHVSLLRADGLDCDVGEVEGGECVAGDERGWVVVGTRGGEVLSFAPPRAGEFPRLVARRALAPGGGGAGGEYEVLDLAPGPRDGAWWVLVRGRSDDRAGTWLGLLEGTLDVTWWAAPGEGVTSLIPMRGQERVWVVCAGGQGARRLGPGGRREVSWAALPMLALGPGVARADGGVALVAPGAVLALDKKGHTRPGQGGFDFLVAGEGP